MYDFSPQQVTVRSAHFIGGCYIEDTAKTNHLDVLRPSDGQIYAGLPMADVDLVDHAVENAWEAFRTSDWATQAPRTRARIMRRWADLIEADVATLAPLEALGSTRPIKDATQWDIPFTAEGIRFFSELADKHGGEVAATRSDHLGMLLTEPYGVIGAIAPWNFPLVMASWKIAPALAAGNAVVLKPSELTPFSVLRLAELAILAGVPAGIFNVIQGDGRITGDRLCRHPRVSKVTFTGSTATGASIMRACAESGTKPVTLELGGKSPQLVFADAHDLDKTARTVAAAITGNAGQVCVSGSRLIVQRSVADRLIEGIQQHMESLLPGPTWSQTTTLAPIISTKQSARIADIVSRSISSGAQLICGGRHAADSAAHYLPTILGRVDRNNEAVQEEIFGPVLTVQSFDDEAEAVALASHPEYGLAAGVHTSDVSRALRMARTLEAGTVWINRYGRSNDFIIPTGGYKRSGMGKDLGRQAFEANLRIKSVLVDFSS